MIHDGVGQQRLEDSAHQAQQSLLYSGYQRVLAGDTTLEEVLRVTEED